MRRHLLLLLALLLGLLGACGQEQITADEIVKRVQETIDATDDVHAVVELSLQSPEKNLSGTVELWLKRTGTDAEGRPTGKLRLVVLEASEAQARDVTIVSDGEQGWAYIPAENQVYTGNIAELKARHSEREGSASTDPLAATEQLRHIVERGLEAFNVELLGEEEVAGHQAYKVKLTPKAETQEQLGIGQLLTVTAWIDQGRWVPLRVVAEAGSLGQGDVRATTLEINSGLSDDLFTFTPPAGAEVVDVMDKIKDAQPQSVTLAEAREAVDFSLLEPAQLPAGVKLISVQLVSSREGDPLVAQVYAGNGMEFSLIQSEGRLPDHEHGRGDQRHAEGREVTVRGQSGQLVESQGRRAMTFLSWEESGRHVAIAGRLSGSQALEIAEGLK